MRHSLFSKLSFIAFVSFLLTQTPVLAEKKAEDFVLTHVKNFNEWELFCGHFGDPAEESCNLRFTAIYSLRPDFRASILFLEPEGEELVLNMAYEPYSMHLFGGLSNANSLDISLAHCLFGRCQLRDDALKSFITSLTDGQDITNRFYDYGIQTKDITIPAHRFEEGYKQFKAEMIRLNKETILP